MTPLEFFLIAFVAVLILGWARAAKGWDKAEADLRSVLHVQRECRRERLRSEEQDKEWPSIIEL